MRLVDASGPWNALPDTETDEVVIAIGRGELVGLANVLGEALQAVDAWEFDTRVGLLPDHARALRDQISEILRRSFQPE